jgi:GATA-type transcription activator-like protein
MQPSTTTYNYLSHSPTQNTQPTASQVNSQYSSQHSWSPIIDPAPASLPYNHWSSTTAQTGSSAYNSNSQQPRQPSYAVHHSSHWSSATFPDTDSPLPPSYRSLSPGYQYSSPENNQGSSGTVETVPPPRGSRRSTPPGSARDYSVGGGRASGNPPAGIPRCSSCKVTTSPEWRKGPSGKKDLCNACVFHISRV